MIIISDVWPSRNFIPVKRRQEGGGGSKYLNERFVAMQRCAWTSVNRKLCMYWEVCNVSPRRLNVPSVGNGFLGSRNIYAPVRAIGRDSVRRVTGMMNDLASSSMIIAPRQSDVSRQVELCPFLAVKSCQQRIYANYMNSHMRAIAEQILIWKYFWS